MGSKSGGTSGYRYYFGLHMGISRGPVDELVQVNVGGKQAWPISSTVQTSGYDVNTIVDGVLVTTPGSPVFTTYPAPASMKNSGQIIIRCPDLFGGDTKEGGIDGTLDVMMGDSGASTKLTAMLGSFVSGFKGMFTLFYDGLICSNNPYPKPWSFRVRRAIKGWDGPVFQPNQAIVRMVTPDSAGTLQDVYAMNPAHIIYECLTNTLWGRGLPSTMLDTTSFTTAADRLMYEGFGLCLKWVRDDDIVTFIQTVIDHIGAVMYMDRGTGLLKLVLIRNDYAVGTLPNFTTANGMLSITEDTATAGDSLVNEVIVTYIDPITGDQKQCRVHNIAGLQATGAIFSKTISYPGIPTHDLAIRVAQRDLRVLGLPLRRFTFTFDRRAWQMAPGAVFTISDTARGITNIVLRAGKVEDNDSDGSTVKVTAVQDIFGLPATATAGLVSTGASPSTSPVPAVNQDIREINYVDLCRNLTPAELAAITPDDSYVFLLASRPSAFAQNFAVNTTPSGGIPSDKATGQFSPIGFLNGPMTEADTGAVLLNYLDMSLVSPGDAALIGNELVQVITWNGTGSLTFQRGCADTIPATHPVNTPVWFPYSGMGADPTRYAVSEVVTGKVLTRAASGELSPNFATPMNITTIGRQNLPYPPGLVKVGSALYTASSVSSSAHPVPVVLSWAERNRLTQANILVGQEGLTMTPEAGTTYTIQILSTTLAVLRTTTGITGTTWSYDNTMWTADGSPSNVFVKLWSVRDSLASWQAYQFPVQIGGASLSAAIAARSTTTGAITTGVKLAAAATNVVTVTLSDKLSATALVSSNVTGILSSTVRLAANAVVSSSSPSAVLFRQPLLSAAASCVVTASLKRSVELQASASCSATASLTTAARLSASVSCVVTVTGDLPTAGWTAVTLSQTQAQNAVNYNGSGYVVLGKDYSFTSSTGASGSWTGHAMPTTFGTFAFKRDTLVWNGSYHVAIAPGQGICWLSFDGGASWSATNVTDLLGVDGSSWSFLVWDGTNHILVSDTGQCSTSPDAVTWTLQSQIGGGISPTTVCSDGAGNIVCYDTLADSMFRSTNHGVTFSYAASLSPSSSFPSHIVWNGTVFCISPRTGPQFFTSPTGATWTARTHSISSKNFIFLGTSGSKIYAFNNTTPTQVYVSTNNGVSWTLDIALPGSLTWQTCAGDGTHAVAVASNSTSTVAYHP